MNDAGIAVDRTDGEVAIVTLTRPDRLNALTVDDFGLLRAALDDVSADDSVRVVILTGAGRGFCAGFDLGGQRATSHGMAGSPRDPAARLWLVQEQFAAITTALRALPQPVIAAVNGPAAGAGLALALACDTRVCDETARFTTAFVRLGLSGAEMGLSYLLPRIVGPTIAFEMMLTGRTVDADEALRSGLVVEVAPPGSVVESARAIADRIRQCPPLAVRMTKQVAWHGLEAHSLSAAMAIETRSQAICGTSADAAEAVRAFSDRRRSSTRL